MNPFGLYGDIKEVQTPHEMKEEMRRLTLHDPMLHTAFLAAGKQGLSDEDLYAIIAYHLLRVRNTLMAQVLQHAYVCTAPHITIVEKGNVV